MERLNAELVRQGQENGPVWCDEKGNLAQASQCQETFVNNLKGIKQERPDIIPENVNVGENYSIGS